MIIYVAIMITCSNSKTHGNGRYESVRYHVWYTCTCSYCEIREEERTNVMHFRTTLVEGGEMHRQE